MGHIEVITGLCNDNVVYTPHSNLLSYFPKAYFKELLFPLKFTSVSEYRKIISTHNLIPINSILPWPQCSKAVLVGIRVKKIEPLNSVLIHILSGWLLCEYIFNLKHKLMGEISVALLF